MITIVGAGPIGSYLGYLLSDSGISNQIIEEHKEIGIPDHCTGLISRNIEGLIDPSSFRKAILNKVNGAVISCGKSEFEVGTKGFKAYVFDRSVFDRCIAEKAEDNGSRLILGCKYSGHKQGEKGLKIRFDDQSGSRYAESSVLVGADGPVSRVAKDSGLYGERKFWIGTQAIASARRQSFEKDKVYVYLDRKYSDGFFAWIVPIDEERLKVGLASLSNPAACLSRFIKDKFGRSGIKIGQKQGGLMPIYQKIPLQSKQKNIFLVGDAALQCKATSGGGVVNGMLAAKELSDAIKSGDFDYERRLGRIRRNLWLHSLIRNKINRMDDCKKEALLRDLNDQKIKNIMQEKGDMDFPRRFLAGLLVSKPRLMRYLL